MTDFSGGLPPEAVNTLMQQTMEIYVAPEIERRKAEGKWADGTLVSAVQVEMSPSKEIPSVRLNEEVPVQAQAKLKAGVRKNKGDPILRSEIEQISDVQFPEPRDPNSAHITMVFVMDTWHLAFDLVYNKPVAQLLIGRASEFLECASDALHRGHFTAAAENLFACFDLSAKAFLLSFRHPAAQNSKRHEATRQYFNALVGKEYSRPLNCLYRLREQARYGLKPFQMSSSELDSFLERAQLLIKDVNDRVRR